MRPKKQLNIDPNHKSIPLDSDFKKDDIHYICRPERSKKDTIINFPYLAISSYTVYLIDTLKSEKNVKSNPPKTSYQRQTNKSN